MDAYKADASGNVGQIKKGCVKLIDDNITLKAEDSGSIVLIATDAKTISLPPTKEGLEYTIINHGADGNNIVTISPTEDDGIAGTITLADSVVARAGTVNTDLVNTKATSKKGDSVTIKGTGIAGTGAWYIISSTGIWA